MSILEALSPQNNVVVSASAGTGKTWLLIGRILRLLLQDIEPGSILAVTFTDKAAAEMKQRLYQQLQAWSVQTDAELSQSLQQLNLQASVQTLALARSLYKKIIHHPHPPQLLTFHTFCKSLLKQFAFEVEIAADFEILSHPSKLKWTAFNHLCEQTIHEPRLMQSMDDLIVLCNHSFSNAQKALFNFLDHGSEWMALTQNTSDAQSHVQNDPTLALEDKLEKTLPQIKEMLHRHSAQLASDTGKRKLASATAMLALYEEMSNMTPNSLLNNVRDIIFLLNTLQGTYYTQAGSLYKHLDLSTDDLSCLTSAENALKSIINTKRNRVWHELGGYLFDEYLKLKQSRRLLDFTDLEWYALQLVQNQAYQYIQCRLSQKIEHILIDEFQDTNPLQWQLIKPLLEEMAAQKDNGSVFIVGDLKQSIYGFRRANPKLQQEASKWIKQHLNGQEYSMNVSYRCSKEIIHYVNTIFMQHENFKNKIESFEVHDTNIKTPGKVAFLPFIEKQKLSPTSDEQNWRRVLQEPPVAKNIDHLAWQEAQLIAQQIDTLISNQTLIHTNAQGEQKQLEYQDILILARRKKNFSYFSKALAQRNIPFISNLNVANTTLIEINDCIALLEFLCNPYNDWALVQVLRCPLFQLDDLHLIELCEAKEKYTSFYQSLVACAQKSSTWKTCLGELNAWLELSLTLPPHDLLNHIYMQKHFIDRYRDLRDKNQKDFSEQYLLGFLHHVLNFNEGRYPNLQSLLIDLKQYQQSTMLEDNSWLEVEQAAYDGVRLMTIHQAKGLEAPVVFLVDTGKYMPPRMTYKPLLSWKSDEEKPSVFMLMPPKQQIDLDIKQQQDELEAREKKEDINLLYVALTRARQYLFVSGSGEKEGGWYEALQHDIAPVLEVELEPLVQQTATASTTLFRTIEEEPILDFPDDLSEVSPSALGQSSQKKSYASVHKDGTLRGTVIHRILYLLAIQQDQVIQQIHDEFPQLDEDQRNACFSEANALRYNKTLDRLFDDTLYKKIFNEMPLSFIWQDKQYYGIIDRLCLSNDAVWIVDYKTHRDIDSSTIPKLAETYFDQMHAYTHGVSLLFPKHQLRTSLVSTTAGTCFDYNFSDSDSSAKR